MIKSQQGFSLIELMIVVAIIGMLASIAIPNYQLFQENARQTEAKGTLSGISAAEQGYFAEYSQYTDRFDAMGFAPVGLVQYNVINWSVFLPPAPQGPQGSPGCNVACTAAQTVNPACPAAYATWTCNVNAAVIIGGSPAVGAIPAGPLETASYFNVVARGLINPSSVDDIWVMDSNQNLVNAQNGL